MSKKLLEESVIQRFMKIAGTSPLAKKFLKENDSTRGATFDPTGTDDRFDNLKESDDEVKEEGKHIDGSDKGLMKEEELEQEGKDLEQEGKELEQEAKSLVGKKPTKVQGGKDQKLTAAKTSTKNSVKEGIGELPPDDEMGMEPEMGSEPQMEPELEGPPSSGGSDVAGLVKAIADAISQHTGVQVDVEGAGVDSDSAGEGLPPPEGDGEGLPAPEGGDDIDSATDEDPLAEDGIVGYKTQAPKTPTGTVAEAKRRKEALVAEITNKVMKRLSEAVKQKQKQSRKPIVQAKKK